VKTIKELKQLCVKCELLTNGKKEKLYKLLLITKPKTQKQKQQCKNKEK